MSGMKWEAEARAVVAGWPPLTEADRRVLTKVAQAVRRREAEQSIRPVAA